MSVPFDDEDMYQGLGQDLLGAANGSPSPYGLGSDLMPRLQQPILAYTPGPQFARDVLLRMKAQDSQSAQMLPPLTQVPRIPTMAPPATMDSTVPQAAVFPGMPSPHLKTDEAMLQDLIESQRPDLGTEGNLIRGFMHPGFTQDMFENYWLGKGDVDLSDARFKDITDYAGTLPLPTGKNAGWVTGPNGETLQKRMYNLYGSPDYRRSLGTSTLFYDQSGKPVGFYDYYNFDPSTPQHPRNRSWDAEAETRIMNWLGSLHGAKDFPIYYGEYVPIK